MKYENVVEGTFIERPNRFVAYVDIDGEKKKCHVKNTGRCRELLIEGSRVILQRSDSPARSTELDLISVYKGDVLINIDSQAPNKVVAESIREMSCFKDIITLKKEFTYGDSRIDIYAESEIKKMLIEVKGVTLEIDGVGLFPDAPTERGLKHIKELEHSLSYGYDPHIIFLIQMEGVEYFTPNYSMHREFAMELEKANKLGVNVIAWDCVVKKDSITLGKEIEVRFDHSYSI